MLDRVLYLGWTNRDLDTSLELWFDTGRMRDGRVIERAFSLLLMSASSDEVEQGWVELACPLPSVAKMHRRNGLIDNSAIAIDHLHYLVLGCTAVLRRHASTE